MKSEQNRASALLKNKKLFVLDMDGTFYLGDKILPGSLDFITKLRETGRDFLFFTNNSSKTSDFYIGKLHKMGCDITHRNIFTSGDVTIKFINDNYRSKPVYLVGTRLLYESFAAAGINLVDDAPELVVIGFDTTLSYEKIMKACKFIRNGSTFLATHPDLNCPTEDGSIPDTGSFCAMLTASTGIKPRYLGKPNKETLDSIVSATGYKDDDIVFVGDRLYTDIAIGFNNGITSILVLSGETRVTDLESSDVRPDLVFESIGDIIEFL